LSRIGLEKAVYLHNYCRTPATFTKKFLELEPAYEFHIGVEMTKLEFQSYAKQFKFKMLFVFKAFNERITVHYLPKKLKLGGTKNVQTPDEADIPLRSL